MTRAIAYDITRLFIGPIFMTPRGIDRVDLALVRHVFRDEGVPHVGILPTPWGVRAYPAPLVRRMLGMLEVLWSETTAAGSDPRLLALANELRIPFAHREPSPPMRLSTWGMAGRICQLLASTGIRLGRSAEGGVPRGAIYVNIGQLGLAVPIFHNWLERRRDVTCAIMLHDVIPLEYPHLVGKAAVGHHARMVRTAARHADCLIFNTAASRDSVLAALRAHRRESLPSLVRMLPLPAAFAEARDGEVPALEGQDYFVVVSTIEPRKNHELLLQVWKRLILRMGGQAPQLVMVGARGFGSDKILAELYHDPLLRSRVHVASDLSSAAVAALVRGARAMLSPSFAEGFGLPVLEACASGVPCIASDIAAHREIGDDRGVVLLPTDDVMAWEQAVCEVPPAAGRYHPMVAHEVTEDAYCADVLEFLQRAATDRA